jgi:hypothetical protein
MGRGFARGLTDLEQYTPEQTLSGGSEFLPGQYRQAYNMLPQVPLYMADPTAVGGGLAARGLMGAARGAQNTASWYRLPKAARRGLKSVLSGGDDAMLMGEMDLAADLGLPAASRGTGVMRALNRATLPARARVMTGGPVPEVFLPEGLMQQASMAVRRKAAAPHGMQVTLANRPTANAAPRWLGDMSLYNVDDVRRTTPEHEGGHALLKRLRGYGGQLEGVPEEAIAAARQQVFDALPLDVQRKMRLEGLAPKIDDELALLAEMDAGGAAQLGQRGYSPAKYGEELWTQRAAEGRHIPGAVSRAAGQVGRGYASPEAIAYAHQLNATPDLALARQVQMATAQRRR